MGEFDDLDPAGLSQSVEDQRTRLQQEKVEADRKMQDEAKRREAEQQDALATAEERTGELFEFLKKAFTGRKMSNNQDLVVERTGSRPEGGGLSRVDEKPPWVVIRAASSPMNARHRPASYSVLEHVLAARCGITTKYELMVYPTLRQDQPESFSTDDRNEFMKRIQDEIAGR